MESSYEKEIINIEENKLENNQNIIIDRKENEEQEIDEKYMQTQRCASIVSDNLPTIKPILLEITHKLSNLFMFTNTHASNVIYIIKKFNEILFKKIANTLNQNKNFIQFFNDVTIIYQNFSNDLLKSNSIINTNITETVLSSNMNNMIEKNQETIAKNFTNFSKMLQTKIISKGPLIKVKELFNRYNNILKEMNLLLNKFEQKKDKIAKKYNIKIFPLISSFKKNYDNDNNLLEIINKYDFYILDVDLVNSINKMYERMNNYLKNYKVCVNNIKDILLDYMEIIKETFEIYINENKTIFSNGLFFNYETMQSFYGTITKEYLEEALTLENILKDDINIIHFNEMLVNYKSNLLRFNSLYKINNENLLEKPELFVISNLKTISGLIDLISDLMPCEIKEDSSLVMYKTNVKRDPGVFSSWKNSFIVITIQDLLIIFDEKITKKFSSKFKLNRITAKLRGDKKTAYKFEIIENKKVLFFNTSNTVILDAITKDRLDDILSFVEKAREIV